MRPHIRSTDYSRSAKRRAEKDANTAMTVSLGQSMRIEELEAQVESLSKELAEYKEKCQKLDKNLEVKEEKAAKGPKICNCGNTWPSKNFSSSTGYICLNCGGECANG